MVSMELFNIVEDIKNVSKVFVVYLRNVNAENATSMFLYFLLIFPFMVVHIFCLSLCQFSYHVMGFVFSEIIILICSLI